MKMPVGANLWGGVVGVPEEIKVEGIKTPEPLMVSVGTATTVGVVTSARENRADMALKIPVVAEPGQRVAVSRRIGGKWRPIGYGGLQGGHPTPPVRRRVPNPTLARPRRDGPDAREAHRLPPPPPGARHREPDLRPLGP